MSIFGTFGAVVLLNNTLWINSGDRDWKVTEGNTSIHMVFQSNNTLFEAGRLSAIAAMILGRGTREAFRQHGEVLRADFLLRDGLPVDSYEAKDLRVEMEAQVCDLTEKVLFHEKTFGAPIQVLQLVELAAQSRIMHVVEAAMTCMLKGEAGLNVHSTDIKVYNQRFRKFCEDVRPMYRALRSLHGRKSERDDLAPPDNPDVGANDSENSSSDEAESSDESTQSDQSDQKQLDDITEQLKKLAFPSDQRESHTFSLRSEGSSPAVPLYGFLDPRLRTEVTPRHHSLGAQTEKTLDEIWATISSSTAWEAICFVPNASPLDTNCVKKLVTWLVESEQLLCFPCVPAEESGPPEGWLVPLCFTDPESLSKRACFELHNKLEEQHRFAVLLLYGVKDRGPWKVLPTEVPRAEDRQLANHTLPLLEELIRRILALAEKEAGTAPPEAYSFEGDWIRQRGIAPESPFLSIDHSIGGSTSGSQAGGTSAGPLERHAPVSDEQTTEQYVRSCSHLGVSVEWMTSFLSGRQKPPNWLRSYRLRLGPWRKARFRKKSTPTSAGTMVSQRVLVLGSHYTRGGKGQKRRFSTVQAPVPSAPAKQRKGRTASDLRTHCVQARFMEDQAAGLPQQQQETPRQPQAAPHRFEVPPAHRRGGGASVERMSIDSACVDGAPALPDPEPISSSWGLRSTPNEFLPDEDQFFEDLEGLPQAAPYLDSMDLGCADLSSEKGGMPDDVLRWNDSPDLTEPTDAGGTLAFAQGSPTSPLQAYSSSSSSFSPPPARLH
ncbi:hypothetical protein KFL_000680100 [Klebsormidium nitens]|uniref:Uncharacterized protein n=1 Tax=Klebsormidium nitens TaxID=105231 RepID=A0A0U9HIL3_KLENI|nr:hypothetical protein KFL_000680100 [Klebsormidium nitens]|eukprot:GAQ80994.1 hypothetical protein KFL_000680100 [Klebsormidium nitens]